MKLEEEFLTIEQARELKELGVSFNSANFGIYNFYESLAEDEINEIRKLDKVLRSKLVTETLSIAEMFEMLPNVIIQGVTNSINYYYFIHDGCSIGYVSWYNSKKRYYKIHIKDYCGLQAKSEICLKEWNLRDALFEMIKWLKQNNYI